MQVEVSLGFFAIAEATDRSRSDVFAVPSILSVLIRRERGGEGGCSILQLDLFQVTFTFRAIDPTPEGFTRVARHKNAQDGPESRDEARGDSHARSRISGFRFRDLESV